MSESSEEEEFRDDAMEDEEEEEEEEEEGEMPTDTGKRAARKSVTSYAEDDDDEGDDDDDDDDSDDDIPLALLAKKAKKESKATKNGSSKKSPAKKASSSAKKPPPPTKKSSNVSSASTDKKYEFASAALYQSESTKGLLIQRLLCRWWYAYTWPNPTSLPAKPPQNYDALDGFPGVYVCTSGDEVGKLWDMRDKNEGPSFANLAKKPAAELQNLLLRALENQKAQLVEHEGSGTATEKELDQLIKWTTKVNPDKAEKQCATVLKASKLKL